MDIILLSFRPCHSHYAEDNHVVLVRITSDSTRKIHLLKLTQGSSDRWLLRPSSKPTHCSQTLWQQGLNCSYWGSCRLVRRGFLPNYRENGMNRIGPASRIALMRTRYDCCVTRAHLCPQRTDSIGRGNQSEEAGRATEKDREI